MKVYGRYGEAEVIDAIVWRSKRAWGFLLPYWRESAVFVVVNPRRTDWLPCVSARRTYVGERRKRQLRRLKERRDREFRA